MARVQAEAARQAEEARQADAARLAARQAAHDVIVRVLQEDAAPSSIANATVRAAAMRGIRMDDAPPEFQQAYLEHIFAWDKAARADIAIAALNSDKSTANTLMAGAIVSVLNLKAAPISDHLREAQRLAELRGGPFGDH